LKDQSQLSSAEWISIVNEMANNFNEIIEGDECGQGLKLLHLACHEGDLSLMEKILSSNHQNTNDDDE